MEIHHYKLLKPPFVVFLESKTAKNLKNGHGTFKAAIAGQEVKSKQYSLSIYQL
jgi:hypothetical protein